MNVASKEVPGAKELRNPVPEGNVAVTQLVTKPGYDSKC